MGLAGTANCIASASVQVQVASAPLTCVANSTSGEMLAVGSSRGACSIVQLNEAMWVSPKEEKGAINAMLEREGLRCELLRCRRALWESLWRKLCGRRHVRCLRGPCWQVLGM